MNEDTIKKAVELDTVNKIVKFYYGIIEEQYKSLKDEVLSGKKIKRITMAISVTSNIAIHGYRDFVLNLLLEIVNSFSIDTYFRDMIISIKD